MVSRSGLSARLTPAAEQSEKRRGRFPRCGRSAQGLDQCDLSVLGHAGGKCRCARGRVEPGAEAQRRLDMLDCRGDQRRNLARPRGNKDLGLSSYIFGLGAGCVLLGLLHTGGAEQFDPRRVGARP